MEEVTKEFIGAVILLSMASVEALRFSVGLIRARNGSSDNPDERYKYYVNKIGKMEEILDENKQILIGNSGTITENTRVLREIQNSISGKDGLMVLVATLQERIDSHIHNDRIHNGKK